MRWRAGRLPFWAVGLMVGLGLANHRAIILMVPGLLLFLALSRRAPLDRPALGLVDIGAALLIAGYGAVVAFCAAYYVDDVEVFFIPAHLIAALLIGEGAMLVRRTTTDHRAEENDE